MQRHAGGRMEIDKEKVDEFMLALLYLRTFKDKDGPLVEDR